MHRQHNLSRRVQLPADQVLLEHPGARGGASRAPSAEGRAALAPQAGAGRRWVQRLRTPGGPSKTHSTPSPPREPGEDAWGSPSRPTNVRVGAVRSEAYGVADCVGSIFRVLGRRSRPRPGVAGRVLPRRKVFPQMTLPLIDPEPGVPAPEGWVPVDRRWHGLDRAAFPYAITVSVLALLLAVVVPWIDQLVPGGTPVRAGRPGGAGRGRGVRARGGLDADRRAPDRRPGSGRRLSEDRRGRPGTRVLLGDHHGLARHGVRAAPAADRLHRRQQQPPGVARDRNPGPFTTTSGERGTLARYRSTTVDGLIAALVLNGTGVAVVITGPVDVPDNPTTDLVGMLTSFHSTKELTR